MPEIIWILCAYCRGSGEYQRYSVSGRFPCFLCHGVGRLIKEVRGHA
jgi:hypothetical protein